MSRESTSASSSYLRNRRIASEAAVRGAKVGYMTPRDRLVFFAIAASVGFASHAAVVAFWPPIVRTERQPQAHPSQPPRLDGPLQADVRTCFTPAEACVVAIVDILE